MAIVAAFACAALLGSIWESPLPAQAQDRPELTPWVSLGPSGPWRVTRIGVSSEWPADPFIIATFGQVSPPNGTTGSTYQPPVPAARSYDGGRTWQPAPALPDGAFTVLSATAHGRVILLMDGGDANSRTLRIRRSTDDGATWTEVATIEKGNRGWETVVSPAVRDDGRLVILAEGKLYESVDAGATWQPRDVVPGQHIENYVFSPNFATDRTVYLSAVTIGHYLRPGRASSIYDAHDLSAGVIVSTDGGATWTESAQALVGPEGPYRHVDELAISPTFARDNTLYVFAWGPWPRRTRGEYDYVTPSMGLFKSADRGQTWEYISAQSSPGADTGSSRSLDIAISPHYADDGVVMACESRAGISAAATAGNVVRGTGFGARWESFRSADYGGCSAVHLTADARVRAYWSMSRQGDRQLWQMDGANGAPQGLGTIWARDTTYMSPVATTTDGTILIGSSGGIWALGPSAVATGGTLPCDVPEPATYTALRGAPSGVGPWLGCPTAAPAEVRVREQRLGGFRTLWFEDARSDWVEMLTYEGVAQLKRHSKETEPWSSPPDRTFAAEVVEYQGGTILRDRGSNATIVSTEKLWEEVTAP